MIWTIVKKELLENFYSLKFRIVAILCIAVILTSHIVLLRDYRVRMEDYALNLPKAGEARVVIKPSVLSLYATGLQRNMGQGYDLWPGSLVMMPSATMPSFDLFSARFAIPDAGYVVKVLLSLLAMLIAFDTFCGEKVRGTLRLLLSNNIPRTHVLLGKILGNLITMWIPFTFAFLFGLLVIMLLGKVTVAPEGLARIGFFYTGSLLYLAIFVLFALTVSAHTDLPSTSLVVCLFLWTILVFGIPNLSGTIARAISPIPSAQALEEEKLLTEQLERRFLETKADGDRKELDERLQHREDDYRNMLDRYVETSRQVSRLSPTSSYIYFASSMTQSSFEDERNLRRFILQYRDALRQRPGKVRELQFAYKTLTFSESLHNIIPDVLTLVLFAGLFLSTASISFLRYDVR